MNVETWVGTKINSTKVLGSLVAWAKLVLNNIMVSCVKTLHYIITIFVSTCFCVEMIFESNVIVLRWQGYALLCNVIGNTMRFESFT